jgi:D-beta-D-heptose 7-phosphate kinase/D-beta-D-heptose 1-phosphate adenosyltransferase
MINIFKNVGYVFDESDYVFLKPHLLNKKIVLTTGCFDLLHEGHIETFKQGKSLGDILIVLLNTDDSIKRLKGNERPINNLNTRLSILSAIKYIDFIIVFDGDSPNEIYNFLQPDILVKCGDYSIDKINTIYNNVKNFITIPLVNNINTTAIINKIKKIK